MSRMSTSAKGRTTSQGHTRDPGPAQAGRPGLLAIWRFGLDRIASPYGGFD
jgi:hypothetical protein